MRSLKGLLQMRGVPPWARARVPVLRLDDAILWVADLGCNADWRAGAGEPGWAPEWRPAAV